MEKTVISWSVENWLTIMLMVVIGYAIIGVALRVASKATGKTND